MNAAVRLGLYGGGLVVAFFAAYFLGGAIVPEEYVERWMEQSVVNEHVQDPIERAPQETNHTEDSDEH